MAKTILVKIAIAALVIAIMASFNKKQTKFSAAVHTLQMEASDE